MHQNHVAATTITVRITLSPSRPARGSRRERPYLPPATASSIASATLIDRTVGPGSTSAYSSSE